MELVSNNCPIVVVKLSFNDTDCTHVQMVMLIFGEPISLNKEPECVLRPFSDIN